MGVAAGEATGTDGTGNTWLAGVPVAVDEAAATFDVVSVAVDTAEVRGTDVAVEVEAPPAPALERDDPGEQPARATIKQRPKLAARAARRLRLLDRLVQGRIGRSCRLTTPVSRAWSQTRSTVKYDVYVQ